MDIVYPYDGRDGASVGIAVSMAGFRKFYARCGDIWTIGADAGERSIPFVDEGKAKASVAHKLLAACNDARISDPFMATWDDIVPLMPFDDVPLRYCGKLRDMKGGRRGSCVRTAKILEDLGYPTLNFETHTPRVIDKRTYIRAMELVDVRSASVHIISVYGNMSDLPKAPGPDAKDALRKAPARIDKALAGLLFVSAPNRCNDLVREWLKARVA